MELGKLFESSELRVAAAAAAALSLALSFERPASAEPLTESTLMQRAPETPPPGPNDIACITPAFLMPKPPSIRRKRARN